MEMFILLAIILANAIALLLVYQFVKRLTKIDKIIFIAICFAISYTLISLACWISGFGIDSQVNEATKKFITYIFVPVNIILLAPFVATKYNKWKAKEIESEEFVKRLIIIGIVGVIILIGECLYFKKIKQNIQNTIPNAQLEETKGQDTTEEKLENGIYENEIVTNVTNTEVANETTNTVSKNVIESTLNKNYLE